MISESHSSPSLARRRIDACAQSPIIRYARISIELTSPMHIGSGSEDSDSDAGIVFDANGLASIPGSSIKGVLRHAYEHYYQQTQDDVPPTSDLFGGPPTDEALSSKNQGGSITVSWARVHDSNNIPIDQPLNQSQIKEDPVLNLASQPELRDHVRLDHRGTAVQRGKFDELIAAPGLRFTFTLEFRGGLDSEGGVRSDEQTAWNNLLMFFSDPLFRFGGKSRRGFGAFTVIAQDHRTFRLDGSSDAVEEGYETYTRSPEVEWELFSHLPTRLHDPLPKINEGPEEEPIDYFWHKETWLDTCGALDLPHRLNQYIEGSLTPDDHTFWMIAGQNQESPSDSAPLISQSIVWTDDTDGSSKALISKSYIIPGSSLKGTLRHRAAFHYRRLTEDWATPENPQPSITQPTAIDSLFGYVKERNSDQSGVIAPEEVAHAGCVYIDDILSIPGVQQAELQNHVAIDRVLGGAMDHFLYDDHPLEGGRITFGIHIKDAEDQEPQAIQALHLAIDDLCHCRLSLGAHAGRGYGFFKGEYTITQSESALTLSTPDPQDS